jgi:AraC-like DNA-binding protein
MDPLSNILSLVKPRRYGSGVLTGGGTWAFDFPAHDGVKCYALVRGQCWVTVDGVREPVRLVTGDCLVLPHGRAFRLGSDLVTPAVDARALLTGKPYNGVITCSPGDDFLLLGGHFALDEGGDRLLKVLPPLVHVTRESEKASLRGAVERTLAEMRNDEPGGLLLTQQNAYTMLVLVLRSYLAEAEGRDVGWLLAVADRRIAAAIASMHESPAYDWTVQALAAAAGMSRTTFAERFRQMMRVSPIAYLTRCRMRLAAERLMLTQDSIAVVAESVGYASESAFTAAFKRTMGAVPREYCAGRTPGAEHRRHGSARLQTHAGSHD